MPLAKACALSPSFLSGNRGCRRLPTGGLDTHLPARARRARPTPRNKRRRSGARHTRAGSGNRRTPIDSLYAGHLPPGFVVEPGVSFPVIPRPPVPEGPDAMTRPLSQAAVNSVWESLPSLFVSAALKSVTVPFAWVCDRLPDLVASALFQAAVQSAGLIFALLFGAVVV